MCNQADNNKNLVSEVKIPIAGFELSVRMGSLKICCKKVLKNSTNTKKRGGN